jgi:hypothetical protein
MPTNKLIENAFEQGKGILRLSPTWVPRFFCVPGRRIKLHPDDYYALGIERGGIDERWLSSTTAADNGPKTAPDEGLSRVVFEHNNELHEFLFKDAIDSLKGELIGQKLWDKHKRWPMFSKFFDNKNPLPYHIHHKDEHAMKVGLLGKPEAYYFPVQMNNHGGDFPYTFFGINPETTKDEVITALKNFVKGDNKITNLSRCYSLEPGTGWDIPPGVLHAPGSLCTYEPQKASDVFAQYQSLVNDQLADGAFLWKDMPKEKVGDFDYLIEIMDWELNIDPDFHRNRFMRPQPVHEIKEMETEGYLENWICYKSSEFSAKELTVYPGRTVTIRDAAAYGLILVQGHGKLGVWDAETPMMIRYGQLTYDEYFVSEQAAVAGVRIANTSKSEPIVMIKHFGPDNPDLIL